jgi:hypothetical protein
VQPNDHVHDCTAILCDLFNFMLVFSDLATCKDVEVYFEAKTKVVQKKIK